MADWRHVAKTLALADGRIDERETNILRRELFGDGILHREELLFLIDLWNEAVEAAPAFHDLVLKAVRAVIMRDGVIDQVETAWLKQLFAKHFGDRERQFLDDLRIHAQRKCPEFEEYCRHMLGA